MSETPQTVFWFESSSFATLPEEAREVNPHIRGKSLALWLGDRLRARGFKTGEPFKEDFGWWTDVEAEHCRLAFICQGEEGSPWGVSAVAEGGGFLAGLTGKDKKKEVALAPLHDAIRSILGSDPSIHSLVEE